MVTWWFMHTMKYETAVKGSHKYTQKLSVKQKMQVTEEYTQRESVHTVLKN